MKTSIISGPIFVDDALFGIGLSYGLTSDMLCDAAFRNPRPTNSLSPSQRN